MRLVDVGLDEVEDRLALRHHPLSPRHGVVVDGHVQGRGLVPPDVQVLPVELPLRRQLVVLVGA